LNLNFSPDTVRSDWTYVWAELIRILFRLSLLGNRPLGRKRSTHI
jgi:hypothetical protein